MRPFHHSLPKGLGTRCISNSHLVLAASTLRSEKSSGLVRCFAFHARGVRRSSFDQGWRIHRASEAEFAELTGADVSKVIVNFLFVGLTPGNRCGPRGARPTVNDELIDDIPVERDHRCRREPSQFGCRPLNPNRLCDLGRRITERRRIY
jgi:hypothetical protein